MKKITQTLATVFFTVLLFSVGMVHAQTVNFDDAGGWPTTAISIDGLVVNGTTYNVTFETATEVFNVFGEFPGTFTFNTEAEATAAAIAMDAALNAANATHIGETTLTIPNIGYEIFHIPYGTVDTGNFLLNEILMALGTRAGDNTWSDAIEWKYYNLDARNWSVFEVDNTAGIDDETFGAAISVYPNPANNYLQIKTTATITAINISDITGKVMQNFQFEVGAPATTLDVSALNAGLYFLKLEDGKGRLSVKKILIQ